MKTPVTLLILTFCSPVFAQDITVAFANDVCACFKNLKLDTYTSSEALGEEMGNCFLNAGKKHQKELKKKKVIDIDKATQAEVENLWKVVFQQCPDVSKTVFARNSELEDNEANTSFQGIITYIQDFEIGGSFKKMGISKEMLMEKMNSDGNWFDTLWVNYRLGSYAQYGNNKIQTTKVYDPDDNIIYTFQLSGNDICSVQKAVDLDLSGAADKPVITLVDTAVTIMGLPCKLIRMKWKLGQVDYYYNETQAKVNPALYAQHTSEGFAEFLKMSGSLPLQVVRSAMGMNIIQTAVAVQEGRVDKDAFYVPPLVEDKNLNAISIPGTTYMRIKK
ncbi:MAG: hypothetical protein HRU69_09545 [Flammeovirgaceae bacterium]|nr:MAG: hypothetical protein HRU69_09545 [Flammeovirgaceae bacterium]